MSDFAGRAARAGLGNAFDVLKRAGACEQSMKSDELSRAGK
jgi:hypothetical protein